MFTYQIDIDNILHLASLNDSNAKVLWEKEDDSVIFRKRLDGKFIINRTFNELLYDRIMAFAYCDKGTLIVSNNSGEVIRGTFRKKDLTISEDKCWIDIKFQRDDEYTCLDGIVDKEINILASFIDKPTCLKKSITMTYGKVYEFSIPCKGNEDIYGTSFEESTGWFGLSDGFTLAQGIQDCNIGNTWWFYQNIYKFTGTDITYNNGGLNNFDIETTYFREIKLLPRLGDEQNDNPIAVVETCGYYMPWYFEETVTINGIVFDKFIRPNVINDLVPVGDGPWELTGNFILRFSSQCNGDTNIYDRCRKLNDVINLLIYDCFPAGFESEFFKSNVNPISERDLSNLMLSQKSDCIDPTSSDPATKGILTFKNLMEYLTEMFQVYWAIDSQGKFRIEHKKYWDQNESYTNTNEVDIDLITVYPMSLYGTNEYTFESGIPIRETFKFMEAWNIDFIGLDIDYSQCITIGDSINHNVDNITTDVDPTLLLSLATKDGFCMFHCESTGNPFKVISEIGKLTGIEIANAHLSWANLHDSYWKYDRYLPSGLMNSIDTPFTVRPLKYQKEISFPYCFPDFNPYKLIRTRLSDADGDGIVRSAEWSFKTSWLTVNLIYRDNN